MKKWSFLFFALPLVLACVGQKDDPEEIYGSEADPYGIEASAAYGTRPFHRVLALEFTASWCQYCPRMATALAQAQATCPGRIVDIAVHQYDEISPEEADGIVALFKASAFPQMVFDWDGETMFNEQSARRMTDYVDATVWSSTCNLAAECLYLSGWLQVKVSVKADEAASYSVAAALVQDNLVVNQVGYGPGYSCMSVLRRFLGEGTDGESLGKLEKAAEKTAVFSTAVSLGEAAAEDFRVVAFVRKNGRVVNAITCPLNGKMDYRYEKEVS